MVPLLLLALAAAGGDSSGGGKGGGGDDFCADRPGLATGTCIVPGGHVQIETSFGEYSRQRQGDSVEKDWSILPTELRIGLDQKTEVRFDLAPMLRSKVTDPSGTTRAHGAGDLTISAKRLLTSDDAKVKVAALPFVTLPVGSRDFTQGRWSEGLLVPSEFELGGPWGLTLTPEADRNPDSEGRGHHWRGALSGELDYQINDRLTLGADWLVARETDGAEHKREAQVGLDAALQVGKRVQFDIEADAGLARSSPDILLISGVAVRF